MSVLDRTWRPDAAIARHSTLRALPGFLFLLDLGLLVVAGALALWGRETLSIFDAPNGVTEDLDFIAALTLPAWLAMIAVCGGYSREAFGSGPDEFKRVLRASLVTAALIGIGCYLAKYDLSRGFFLLGVISGTVLLLLGRLAVRQALHTARRRGRFQVHVLVAGTPRRVDEVSHVLTRENWLGYSVIGAALPADQMVVETASGVPVLGTTADLVGLAKTHGADILFLTSGTLGSAEQVKELGWELEQHEINLVIAPTLADISSDRMKVRPVGGVPLIHVDHPRWAQAGRVGKRTFDVLGATMILAFLFPMFLVASIAVWLHDRGPVFFSQQRVGRRGETFDCLKFRTMVVDAEARLQQLKDSTGFEGGLFKMTADPRITAPGRWLRRLSIDELPQLINVLRGDMSLVGPRPALPGEAREYDQHVARRLHVRPGMTGLWQVSGRSDLTRQEAIRLDIYYVDNWSMMQDLTILARTFTAVLSSRGAY